jgi:hypothetical protein
MATQSTSDSDSFMDCSTLNISYAANGLASISFTIYTPKTSGAPYVPGGPGLEINAGGVTFKGFVLEQSLVPASEVEYNEFKVSAIALGTKTGAGLSANC